MPPMPLPVEQRTSAAEERRATPSNICSSPEAQFQHLCKTFESKLAHLENILTQTTQTTQMY